MSLSRVRLPSSRVTRERPARGGPTRRSPVVEEARSEANVPAEQSPSGEAPRVPASHVDSGRPAGATRPSAEGSTPAVGLIWRVRGRAAFAALRRHGYRVRSGPVAVTFLADTASAAPAEPPKVAFAVGRRVGRAVRRNRVRRQLRSIMRELVAQPDTLVGPGTYLVATGPEVTTLSYQELRNTVQKAMAQIPAARRVAREDVR